MFNVGPAEVLLILVVALLVLGPKKLPDAARQMGKAMSEFRRVTTGLQEEVRGVLDDHLTDPPVVEPAPPEAMTPAPPTVMTPPPALPIEAAVDAPPTVEHEGNGSPAPAQGDAPPA